jgi:hypothetical protein
MIPPIRVVKVSSLVLAIRRVYTFLACLSESQGSLPSIWVGSLVLVNMSWDLNFLPFSDREYPPID